MVLNTGTYVANTRSKCDDNVWTISKDELKPHTYDEAVDMTGHGVYSIGLLLASSFAICGCVLDMFALPAITSVAACDLHLTAREEKILISLPFLGALVMAYPWGYISDTKGRRASMLVSMWASFGASCLAAFSPHWIMLGVLKFISVSFSSCSMTTAYTLIGECCGSKVKAVYFFLMTSIIHVTFPFQMSLHYFSLTLDFSIDLGLISFVPWRLLAIIIALPLGISAICLHFHYESPKFLVNADQERAAVEILEKIWIRNGGTGKYPVKKLILNEDGNSRPSEALFWQSLWNRIKPLFKMPLLMRTLQLYYLCMVVYSTCGGLLSWFPYLANAFISGKLSDSNSTEGLCNMISHYNMLTKTAGHSVSCVPKSDVAVVWASLAQGLSLSTINITISVAARRRKLIIIIILFISGLAALGCAFISNNIVSLIAYFTIFLAAVSIGIIISYFVDLYPTSYRGMVSCLSMLVARFSNLASVNVIGHIFMSHCHATFYIVSAILFSGAVVSCFLPSDKPKKNNTI